MQKKRPINTRVTKTNKEHDDNPMLKDPPKSLESKEWDDFGFRQVVKDQKTCEFCFDYSQ